ARSRRRLKTAQRVMKTAASEEDRRLRRWWLSTPATVPSALRRCRHARDLLLECAGRPRRRHRGDGGNRQQRGERQIDDDGRWNEEARRQECMPDVEQHEDRRDGGNRIG